MKNTRSIARLRTVGQFLRPSIVQPACGLGSVMNCYDDDDDDDGWFFLFFVVLLMFEL